MSTTLSKGSDSSPEVDANESSFDATSDDITLRLTMECLDASTSRDDPEYYVRPIDGQVLGGVLSGDSPVLLGELELHLLLTEFSPEIRYFAGEVDDGLGRLAYDLFDEIGLAPSLTEAYAVPSSPNVLVISKLTVLPKYRGHGIGTYAMGLLIESVAPLCGLMALKPFPIECPKIGPDDPEDVKVRKQPSITMGAKRLQNFYERLGFRLLTDEHMTLGAELKQQPSLAKCRKLRRSFIGHL